MRRNTKWLLCLSLLCFVGKWAVAQNSGESTEVDQQAPRSFTTYFGKEIQVGDTLWIGKPTKEYYYDAPVVLNRTNEQNRFIVPDLRERPKEPLIVTEVLPKQRQLRNSTSGTTKAVLKCITTDSVTMLLDVDQAMYDDLIQMVDKDYDMSFRSSCVELTPLHKFLYRIQYKLIALDDKSLMQYMKLVDPDKAEECEYDQFLFRRVREEYYDRLNQDLATLVDQMEKGTIFYERRPNALPKNLTYDPEIGGYYYSKLYDCNRASESDGYSRSDDIFFQYQPCETILRMPEVEAERYERKLKGNSRYLYSSDRHESIVIYMKLMPYDDNPNNFLWRRYVRAMLMLVEVFADPSGEVNFLGYATYDPDHYKNVEKELKRKARRETTSAVIGGVLGILSLF